MVQWDFDRYHLDDIVEEVPTPANATFTIEEFCKSEICEQNLGQAYCRNECLEGEIPGEQINVF